MLLFVEQRSQEDVFVFWVWDQLPKRLVPQGSEHSCQQGCKWKFRLDRKLKVRTKSLSNELWNWKRKGWDKEGQMLKSCRSMALIHDSMR
jgi:hypothetical protein